MRPHSVRRRPGRPPGGPDTRGSILSSARKLFAANGINNTTIRSIAVDAGVDPALIHHYFGTKAELFATAVDIPIDPMTVFRPLRETPVEQLGLKLPLLLLPLWDSLGDGLVATLRSLLSGAEVSLVRSFMQDLITAEIAPRIDNPPGSGRLRVQFVASQLVGVVMARYIIRLEPFASLPPDEIAHTIAPNLQHYLTGELGGPDSRFQPAR
jgi:AcrR family transcriptional regulator